MTPSSKPDGQVARSTPVTVEKVLAMARAQQRAGNLEIAQRLYQQILARIPEQVQALTMLGSIAYQQGDDSAGDQLVEQAIAILARALAGKPMTTPEQAGLANLLLARNRPKDAVERLASVTLPLNPVRSSAAEFGMQRRKAKMAGLPSILMTAIPKSASESLWNALAEGLGLAQSHVSIGLFPDCCLVPYRLRDLATGGVIAKEHIAPNEHNIAMLKEAGIDHLLVHLRDPRQALLSWAHFVRDDVSRRMLAPIWRKTVPPARLLDRSLHDVIDWCFEHYLPLLIDFAEGWHRQEDNGDSGLKVHCLTFETFVLDRDRYLADVLKFFELDSGNLTSGGRGATVHWRRGRIDEWRMMFSAAQLQQASDALPGSLSARFGWAP